MRLAAAPARFYLALHEAALMLDVVYELVAEMLDEALHRQRGRVAERTDRAAGDVVRHVVEEVEVLHAPCAVLDAVHDAVEPARALAAGRALAARFFKIKIREALERPPHACALVH